MAEQPYKGRSSIRNTNTTKSLNENMNETTKSNKRVSFSSRNRVKTFVKGTETTQWDLTYEEAVNHTDSTQSSQESTNKSLDKNTQKIEGSLIDFIKQTQQQQQIEYDDDYANQTMVNNESLSMEIEVIDRTTQIHVNNRMVAVDKENLLSTIINDKQMGVIDKENLPLPSIIINDNCNMEITCQNQQISNIDMEITKQDDQSQIIEEKQREIFNKSVLNVEDMEFTCRLPKLSENVDNLSCQQEKIDKIALKDDQLLNENNATQDMEFTCNLPNFVSNKRQSFSGNEIDMEFTCQLSWTSVHGEIVEKPPTTGPQAEVIDGMGVEKDDMEITCRLPGFVDCGANKTSLNSTKIDENVGKTCAENTEQPPVIIEEHKEILEKTATTSTTDKRKGENLGEFQLQQSQNVGDDQQMEWSTITPQKSTIADDNNVDNNVTEKARKRSLLSSFIPFDSPQIIKKPTLLTPKSERLTTPGSGKTKNSKIATPTNLGSKKQLTQLLSNNNTTILDGTVDDKKNINFLTPSNTPIIDNKNILYSLKVDKNLRQGICDFTDIKTPDRSGVKIMSPCIDDTQQLIGATFTVPSVEHEDVKQLETTTTTTNRLQEINITLPNTNFTQTSIDDVRRHCLNITDMSLTENPLFQNINNTFVLNKMSNNNYNETKYGESLYLDDCSIELVSSPNNSKISDEDGAHGGGGGGDEYDFPLIRKALENCQITEFRCEIDDNQCYVDTKQQQQIMDFITNFQFKSNDLIPLDKIEKLMDDVKLTYYEEQQELQNNSIIEISATVNNECSLEQRIRSLGKGRDENIWKLVEINNNFYKFSIFFNKIILVVELDIDNENVSNITLDIAIPQDKTTNLLIYIHKAIQQKLSITNVQSSLGQSYDLIAFLQYIEIIVEKFLSFNKEFTVLRFYDPTFDKDGWLSFKIRDPKLLKFFVISVNMLNLENLTDDDVKCTSIIGNCNVKRVKKIAQKCSKFRKFLRNFIKAIEEHGI